ncbi:MAG: DNA repair protein RecO [Defluviicoccus sp.]|nr:DNA repair protein RecO [Defluviicoccus sp.]
MEWSDDGIVLAARPHGEGAAVLSLLTRAHGRHPGLVRGASGGLRRGFLQPGATVSASWRSRLADALGSYTCELKTAVSAAVLADRARLDALAAACAVLETTLPEREPMTAVFLTAESLLAVLALAERWAADYVRWELALLAELGYGLDLTQCAVTGATADLAYVSPRTGRAVTRTVGAPYRPKLLALPPFLTALGAPATAAEIGQGMALAGYFLERYVYGVRHQGLPAARRRLAERFPAADGGGTNAAGEG